MGYGSFMISSKQLWNSYSAMLHLKMRTREKSIGAHTKRPKKLDLKKCSLVEIRPWKRALRSGKWYHHARSFSLWLDALAPQPPCRALRFLAAPEIYRTNYTSCSDAMIRGGIHPEPGKPLTLTLTDSSSANCSMENIYGASNACPRGWNGNADRQFCFKVFTKPETNEDACRYDPN